MNLSESQLNALETTYQELKGSVKKLGKQQRKVLVEHTKLSESQVDQWVETKNQALTEEMDSADFIPEPGEALKAALSRRGRGVVASKVPSKEDVEVVDILDEEEEELVELSLEETPERGCSKKLKTKDDVKLTMVRNQQQVKTVKSAGVKTAFSQ